MDLDASAQAGGTKGDGEEEEEEYPSSSLEKEEEEELDPYAVYDLAFVRSFGRRAVDEFDPDTLRGTSAALMGTPEKTQSRLFWSLHF
jgi:hypothetical protein